MDSNSEVMNEIIIEILVVDVNIVGHRNSPTTPQNAEKKRASPFSGVLRGTPAGRRDTTVCTRGCTACLHYHVAAAA